MVDLLPLKSLIDLTSRWLSSFHHQKSSLIRTLAIDLGTIQGSFQENDDVKTSSFNLDMMGLKITRQRCIYEYIFIPFAYASQLILLHMIRGVLSFWHCTHYQCSERFRTLTKVNLFYSHFIFHTMLHFWIKIFSIIIFYK